VTRDRRLLVSSGIVASGFAASKILGLLREVLIARTFGTTGELDAFFAATSFADLLFAVLAGGSLASVFIPVFSTFLVRDESARLAGWHFASAVVTDVFFVVAVFAALGALFAVPLVEHVLAPGFAPAQRALTVEIMRLVLISTVIFGVSGTLTGILHAHQHFVLPAFAPSLYNLGIIVGAVWLAPHFGILGLAYGVVAGSAAHLLIQVPALVRHRARFFWTFGRGQTAMRDLIGLLGPRMVTMLVVRATWVLMTNLASRLGEGSVSALSYAYSLWQFPETLIGTAIALAAFPRLSEHVARNDADAFRATYRRALMAILGLAIPATLALAVFAEPLVALVFARGAFGSASVALVATVLQFYALAIVGESLLELTARVFYARHDARTPMFVALVTMLLRAGMMLWWSAWWGAPGLALAYAVGAILEGGTLGWLARAPTRKID